MSDVIIDGERTFIKSKVKIILEDIIKSNGTCLCVVDVNMGCKNCILFSKYNCYSLYVRTTRVLPYFDWKRDRAVRKYIEVFGTEMLMEFLL
jgi:hypothetical protein